MRPLATPLHDWHMRFPSPAEGLPAMQPQPSPDLPTRVPPWNHPSAQCPPTAPPSAAAFTHAPRTPAAMAARHTHATPPAQSHTTTRPTHDPAIAFM